VTPQASGESSKIKVKVRVGMNGTFSVSSATMTEKVEVPAVSPVVEEPMEVDTGSAEKKNGTASETTTKSEKPEEKDDAPAAADGENAPPPGAAGADVEENGLDGVKCAENEVN